ncbi:amidohydrolase family protein [Lysobacter gummosus]|uniref:amidohydrolase family protein n=2 Tax=Lysobacteraceae TaxID=32033 RepID=UPI003629658B
MPRRTHWFKRERIRDVKTAGCGQCAQASRSAGGARSTRRRADAGRFASHRGTGFALGEKTCDMARSPTRSHARAAGFAGYQDIGPPLRISDEARSMIKHAILGLMLFCLSPLALAQDEVFDVHVHLWHGEKSLKEYYAQLEAEHQPVARHSGIYMAIKGETQENRRKNDELIALSKRYPKLMPIASVHPLDGQVAIDELKRLAGLGVKAIKLHPHTQRFDITDPQVRALCKLAGELGVAVLFDNFNIVPGDNQNLFNLAVGLPKTQFIFAHMGGLDFRFWNSLFLARTAKDFFFDNIHFDISATVALVADSPVEPEFVWTIRNVGIDNVMLGSDYPQLSLKQAGDALEKLDLSAEEKRKIRWGNANKLFGGKR